jgi:acetyl-CoA carboxylase biotin carboxyl carrier protein
LNQATQAWIVKRGNRTDSRKIEDLLFTGASVSRIAVTIIVPAFPPLSSGPSPRAQEAELPDVEAHITGTVWKIEVEVGDNVNEGDTVVILESMKMEMPVEAEDPGVVREIRCEEGQSVSEGDTLVVLD